MRKEWKERLDELELQLALGVKEGQEAFEKQKKKMLATIEEALDQLNDLRGFSNEQRLKLRKKLEEAQVQLALGRAEGKEAFEKQKARFEEIMKELQDTLNEATDEGDKTANHWARQLGHTIQTFRIQLDVFRIYYNLGKAEADEKTEQYREEMRQTIHAFRQKIEEWSEGSEDKIDAFSEEMKASIDHFGKAFKRILS